MAIIIKTGSKTENAVTLAQRILSINKGENEKADTGLKDLLNVTLEEFMKINGIGKVKAIQLKALCELTKRMYSPLVENITIKSSEDIANLLMNELRYEKREKIKLIILNSKNNIIKIRDVSYGTNSSAIMEPKDILAEPIKMGANKIILLHNHPSGNATPSKEDFEVTKRIKLCAEMFGIKLLDHIVIGDGEYRSAFV